MTARLKKLPASDPYRIRMTDQLLDKLFAMGLIPTKKSLEQVRFVLSRHPSCCACAADTIRTTAEYKAKGGLLDQHCASARTATSFLRRRLLLLLR